MNIKYCLFTSTKPKCVTKKYKLENNALVKETSAEMYEGKMQIKSVNSAAEFALTMSQLQYDQCHSYGVPPNDALLVSKSKWEDIGCPSNSLPRTLEIFNWPAGPGIMLLDRDAPKEFGLNLSRSDLLAKLVAACPEVENTDLVWWPSSSSHIYQDEVDLTGLRGQHLYFFVKDAFDIERAGKTLNERLWAMGEGHFEISASGNLLKKSVFDDHVWQPNHIDFAAGAHCSSGLEQRRGNPFVVGNGMFRFLDTRKAIPDLSTTEKELSALNQERAKEKLHTEAKERRAVWEATRLAEIKNKVPKVNFQEATRDLQRATERKELIGDFQITIQTDSKTESTLTVKQILESPAKYNGLLTLDPLEPDYDGRRFVGKLFLSGRLPNLFSFAHGGTNFRLIKKVTKIELITGRTNVAIDELLIAMRSAPDLFDFGQKLVQIGSGGSLLLLTDNSLRYVTGGLVQFWRHFQPQSRPLIQQFRDPPTGVCKTVMDLKDARKLKRLNAVITAPILRADGSLLLVAGYDERTELFLDLPNNKSNVSKNPSPEEALKALEFLWEPFKDFPFCSGLDRAVHLAAVLTAAVRPVLPAAPGFAYDAPILGSGKTLLARCAGVLAQGSEPSVWPHTAGTNDEEVRKRIFTVLSSGARVLVWDNVVGSFDSAALASCMTSPAYTDRILGKSDSTTVPNRMLMLFTGNNIQLQGEMPRRILVSRIDPATEKPFAREFTLDPFSYCRTNRQQMIAAALTLIRAFLTHGCTQEINGKLASFEEWDMWVRRTVIYADQIKPRMFGDVMDVVKANQSVDPEQETLVTLLSAWFDIFASSPVHAATVMNQATDLGAAFSGPQRTLKDAIYGLPLSDFQRKSTRSFGKYLSFRKDRRVGGYCLRQGPRIEDKTSWFVERLTNTIVAGGV